MKTIAFTTLGCKVNEYDTQAMRELFEAAGWRSVPFSQEADVYLINTCTVTSTGDNKSMKTIRRTAREHPGADLIVSGCLAQKDAQRVAIEGVRLIIGSSRRGEVVSLYEQAVTAQEQLIAVQSLKYAPFERLQVSGHENRTRAIMKIQEGCDRYCTYCIIPYVRGSVRSMPISDVRAEAQRLSDSGYREIVLTGIHLASYGRDTGDTLLDAVHAVSEPESLDRVRLGSLEPTLITPEFLKEAQKCEKLCPHFHLSMQSGSKSVLERMRRRYTPDEYAHAVELLRETFPGCAVTTDVITGFPGETEWEYLETERFVEQIGFSRIHVFPYSRREGTIADRMPNQVPEEKRRSRAKRLIEIGNKLEETYVKSLIGREEEVLFETQNDDDLSEGYTRSYVRVSAKAKAGEIKQVKIISANGKTLRGEVL